VLKPGLYQLPAEARVGDAIQMAGGLAPDANPIVVNQAEKLWDGVQVHVPSLIEPQAELQPPAGLSGSQPPSMVVPDNRAADVSTAGAINLNQATLEQLDTLPGIGPTKGQAIIDHRPYATVDDLERVPGIGASTIAQLRDLVTTE
jgi:competence protein ComEA